MLAAVAAVVSGFGLAVALPAGWVGHVRPGEVDAIAPSGAFVELVEGRVAAQRVAALPRRLGAGWTRRWVAVGGRRFFLEAHATPARAAEASHVLRSLRVRAWRGALAPPAFAPAPGFFAGSSGATVRGRAAQASAFASTAPYRDSPVDLPPVATLRAAPPRAIVLWVGLSPLRARSPEPVRRDPLDLRAARCSASWEGAIRGVTLCTLWSRLPGRYEVSVYAYFRGGASRAVARRELRRLRLPRWS